MFQVEKNLPLSESSASASSERSVSHHVSNSRAAVLAVLVFFYKVGPVQSNDGALWVDVPHRTIQCWLHQHCVTKRAWCLVIGYQAFLSQSTRACKAWITAICEASMIAITLHCAAILPAGSPLHCGGQPYRSFGTEDV